MPTIYISSLNAASNVAQATYTGAQTAAGSVNGTAVTGGTINRDAFAAACLWYATPTDASTDVPASNSDSLNGNFVGKAKTAMAGSSVTHGTIDTAMGASFLGVLAGEIFGHSEMHDLISNSASVKTSFSTAGDTCDDLVEASTSSSASMELLNGLLATVPARFGLDYNATLTTTTGAAVGTVSTTLTGGTSSATVAADIEMIGTDTAGIARITVTAAPSGTFVIGDTVTSAVGGGGGSSVITITPINSVQLGMLNGTLDATAGHEPPIEDGDIFTMIYTISSHGSQTDINNEAISAAHTALYSFTAN